MPLEQLRPWLALQAWLTILLVVVLQMLYLFLHKRRFVLWWAWGWAAFAALMGSAWGVLEIGSRATTARLALLCVVSVAGMLQVACFALASRELHHPVGRRAVVFVVVAAAVMGAVMFVLSIQHSNREMRYVIRHVPHEITLGGAYLYSAYALFRWSRRKRSLGALLGAVSCLAYAAAQGTYLEARLHATLVGIPHTEALARSFMFDLGSEAGIFVGTVLLFLEENRSIQRRLDLYASVVPTCCRCGLVRDDTTAGREKGPWVALADFVAQHSAAQFSHTYCPRCLRVWRMEAGLPPPTEENGGGTMPLTEPVLNARWERRL